MLTVCKLRLERLSFNRPETTRSVFAAVRAAGFPGKCVASERAKRKTFLGFATR